MGVSLNSDKTAIEQMPFDIVEKLNKGYYYTFGCDEEYPDSIAFTSITMDEWRRYSEECFDYEKGKYREGCILAGEPINDDFSFQVCFWQDNR